MLRNLAYIIYPVSFLICLILNACRTYKIYEPQPIDVQITEENGRVTVSGAPVFSLPNQFVWCGSPMKDKHTTYLFFSTWVSGQSNPPFEDGWLIHSQIGLAKTDDLNHPFELVNIFLKGRKMQGDSTAWDAQMVHNPHIQHFGDSYYLYYIGGKDSGVQPKGSLGESVNLRNRIQQNQHIGVLIFTSFEALLKGDFKRLDAPLLSPRTRVKTKDVVNPSAIGTVAMPDNMIVVNPSVVQRPSDGKYLMYFKGNQYDPTWRGVHGVAIGDTPLGPFKALDDFIFDVPDAAGNKVSAEDPYVWYNKKDKLFYAVLKDFTGKLTAGESGLAMMISKNGIDWQPARQRLFMKKELILTNGTHLKLANLERPSVMTNNKGEPIMLFAACSVEKVGGKRDGTTFNIHIPIKIKKVKNKPKFIVR